VGAPHGAGSHTKLHVFHMAHMARASAVLSRHAPIWSVGGGWVVPSPRRLRYMLNIALTPPVATPGPMVPGTYCCVAHATRVLARVLTAMCGEHMLQQAGAELDACTLLPARWRAQPDLAGCRGTTSSCPHLPKRGVWRQELLWCTGILCGRPVQGCSRLYSHMWLYSHA
jgi:hypothetical protein